MHWIPYCYSLPSWEYIIAGGFKLVWCVCACLSVRILTDVWRTDPKFSGWVEFEGQGQSSRSLGWKTWFPKFLMGLPMQIHFVIWRHVRLRHYVVASHHLRLCARILTRRERHGRALQHSGGFIPSFWAHLCKLHDGLICAVFRLSVVQFKMAI